MTMRCVINISGRDGRLSCTEIGHCNIAVLHMIQEGETYWIMILSNNCLSSFTFHDFSIVKWGMGAFMSLRLFSIFNIFFYSKPVFV